MPNIIVCVKHSYDVQQLRYDPSTRKFMLAGSPKKMSDMDRRAVEEAIRIKEKHGGKVIALTVGNEDSIDTIRLAYAMGADEGYAVIIKDKDYESELDTNNIAYILAQAIKKIGNFDLILCGAASTDGYSKQVPPKLAVYLGLPFINFVRELRIEGNYAIGTSDYEDGLYTFKAPLPAVVAVTLDINEPRNPTPMAIIRASRKPVNTWTLKDLNIDNIASSIEVIDTYVPEVKRKHVIIDASTDDKIDKAVQELIDALRKEGVI